MSLPAYKSYKFFNVTSPAEGVAHVEINRPEKLNAFSQPVWLEFGSVFKQIQHDEDVRVVILTGAGDRAFTAGLDVQAAASGGPFQGHEDAGIAKRAKLLREHIEEFQDCVTAMEKCEKPVIGVFHGISIGLGMDLACCTDIRMASADTRFSVKEVDIGIPADIGTLARLPKIVGSNSWVKDVCLTARYFDAKEAQAVGLVSQVYENKAKTFEAAVQLGKLIASKSPIAVQGTKELLNYGREHGTTDALHYTKAWNSVAVQAEDFPKALMSGISKTKPTFSKL